jgi:hypothetical protein
MPSVNKIVEYFVGFCICVLIGTCTAQEVRKTFATPVGVSK